MTWFELGLAFLLGVFACAVVQLFILDRLAREVHEVNLELIERERANQEK